MRAVNLVSTILILIFASTQASCTRTEYAGGEAFEVHFEENHNIGNCSLSYLWKNYNTTWDEVLENIDKCVSEAGGYDSINPVRTASNSSFEPKINLDIILYALVDLDNNVLGVDTNASNLEYIKHNKNNTLSKRETLAVVPVTENFTDQYKPHEELVKRGMAYDHGPSYARDKRSWSGIGKYLFYYVSGAASLKIVEKHTKSGVVKKVYNAYISVAGYSAYALGDLTELIAQQFRQARQDRGGNSFAAAGAEDMATRIAGWFGVKKRLECPTGSPSWCELFKAPMFKSDICVSSVNSYGVDDTSQEESWSSWYAKYMCDSSTWGTTANHLYWSLGDGAQSYWVMSFEIRPGVKDAEVSFQGCDDAPW